MPGFPFDAMTALVACGGGGLEASEGFTIAITEDGDLLAFGCGDKGKLGNGRCQEVSNKHKNALS